MASALGKSVLLFSSHQKAEGGKKDPRKVVWQVMQSLKRQSPRFDVWPHTNTFSHSIAFECCSALQCNGGCYQVSWSPEEKWFPQKHQYSFLKPQQRHAAFIKCIFSEVYILWETKWRAAPKGWLDLALACTGVSLFPPLFGSAIWKAYGREGCSTTLISIA